MNTRVAPLRYMRLTTAGSVIRRGGLFTSVRTPAQADLVGVEGTDWFIGGHLYEVTQAVADELDAAGFGGNLLGGFGYGPYGFGPYGGLS